MGNVLFAQELSDRLNLDDGGHKTFVNVCSPGMTATNVTADFRIRMRRFSSTYPAVSPLVELTISAFNTIEKLMTHSTADGARTQIYLAMSPEVEQKQLTGKYFHPHAIQVPTNALAQGKRGKELGQRLWQFSDQLLHARGF